MFRTRDFDRAVNGAEVECQIASDNVAGARSLSVMENILQADGDIKGVFAHNDEMALGAVEAIASTGKDIKVVGFDATDDARKAVEDGTMAATVAQQPELMGKTAVETAISIMEGKSVEKSIPVEVTLIKK
ncbi:substrate-binding domain-containing protein [Lacrimispora sp.]|uniref:substrate-binding domain-containing protein n=1 Tax=Lacrimispora sp. TaxID=2719234 RepID=UPI002F42EA76